MMLNKLIKKYLKVQDGIIFHISPINYAKPMVLFLKEKYKYDVKGLTGVEVGVFIGRNALTMLRLLNIKRLYLIDPFVKYKYMNTMDSKEQGDMLYGSLKRRMKKYNEKVSIIRKSSAEAIEDIPSNLDFVYLDGDYDYLKYEIKLWYDKLKIGGVLGGYAFTPQYIVSNVVLDFGNRFGLKVQWSINDWWIIKK